MRVTRLVLPCWTLQVFCIGFIDLVKYLTHASMPVDGLLC